jgi:hypothetical protein
MSYRNGITKSLEWDVEGRLRRRVMLDRDGNVTSGLVITGNPRAGVVEVAELSSGGERAMAYREFVREGSVLVRLVHPSQAVDLEYDTLQGDLFVYGEDGRVLSTVVDQEEGYTCNYDDAGYLVRVDLGPVGGQLFHSQHFHYEGAGRLSHIVFESPSERSTSHVVWEGGYAYLETRENPDQVDRYSSIEPGCAELLFDGCAPSAAPPPPRGAAYALPGLSSGADVDRPPAGRELVD